MVGVEMSGYKSIQALISELEEEQIQARQLSLNSDNTQALQWLIFYEGIICRLKNIAEPKLATTEEKSCESCSWKLPNDCGLKISECFIYGDFRKWEQVKEITNELIDKVEAIEQGKAKWKELGEPIERLKVGAKVLNKDGFHRHFLKTTDEGVVVNFTPMSNEKEVVAHEDLKLHNETYANLNDWLEPTDEEAWEDAKAFSACQPTQKEVDRHMLIKSIAEKPIEEWAGFIKGRPEMYLKTRGMVGTYDGFTSFTHVNSLSKSMCYYVKPEDIEIPASANKLEWIAENVNFEGYNMAEYRKEANNQQGEKASKALKQMGVDFRSSNQPPHHKLCNWKNGGVWPKEEPVYYTDYRRNAVQGK